MDPTPETVRIHQTRPQANEDGKFCCSYSLYLKHSFIISYMIGEEDGVILEDDSEDEEGYVFAGRGSFLMFTFIVCLYYASFLDSCC